MIEGPQGLVSHLVCGGVYDWSTGLIFKDNRYFDPTLGIWLSLAPLVVLQGAKKGKKRRWWERWYVMLVILAGIGGMLVGCGSSQIDYDTVEDNVCTEVPPPSPIQSIGVNIAHYRGPNATSDGGHNWQVKFELEKPAPEGGGWIVQKIKQSAWKFNGETDAWEPIPLDPKFIANPYWEAWRIEAGQTKRPGLYDDAYYSPGKDIPQSPYTIKATIIEGIVEFYSGSSKKSDNAPGEKIPSGVGWDQNQTGQPHDYGWEIRDRDYLLHWLNKPESKREPMTRAGILPATHIEPPFWDNCGTLHNLAIYWTGDSVWGAVRWGNRISKFQQGDPPAIWSLPPGAWV